MVGIDGLSLVNVPEEFKDNKQVVIKAIQQNGNSLQYASENLRND